MNKLIVFLGIVTCFLISCNDDSTPPVTETEYWELLDSVIYKTLPPGSENYSITVGNGSIKARYALGNDEWEFLCTYTIPPNKIHVSDKVPINMAVSILINSGQQYSANGGFVIFFDDPAIEPGFVNRPIFLKTTNEVISSISLTHRLGVPPAPASNLTVYIDGKSLPTGSNGDRIALLVDVGNGRNFGYKYIYEWKGK